MKDFVEMFRKRRLKVGAFLLEARTRLLLKRFLFYFCEMESRNSVENLIGKDVTTRDIEKVNGNWKLCASVAGLFC